jgi:uncharacterized membrane protein YfcA
MDGQLLILQMAIGLASGAIMSLVGASAVMVIVPALTLILGYSMHNAIGVSLLVDVLASIAIGYSYWRHGNVDLSNSFWIAVGSILGAQLGAGCTVALPDVLLAVSYGLWMISAGITIWRKGFDRTSIVGRFSRFMQFDSKPKKIAVTLFFGFIIGLNCGVFGAGGGVLIMIVLLFILDYSISSAIGTSTVMMAMTATSATVGYLLRGNIDVSTSIIISVGTIIGGTAGAKFVNASDERLLSQVVGGVFVTLGLIMSILRFI